MINYMKKLSQNKGVSRFEDNPKESGRNIQCHGIFSFASMEVVSFALVVSCQDKKPSLIKLGFKEGF